MVDWSAPIRSPGDVAAVEAAATRIETACGDGTMVWRVWDPASGEADASARPVVLLHGGSGSWTHWVRNIGALVGAGRRVCVPDLPGFGESAPPDGDDVDAIPRWLQAGLAEVVDDAMGDARCDVVGFSLGGLAAGLWAGAFPARIARLVLVGAPALTGTFPVRIELRAWHGEPAGPRRDAAHRHNLRELMLARDASVDALGLALHAANVERDRLRLRRLMRTDALRRLLPALACEIHGIWGAEDVLYRGRLGVVEEALRRAPAFRGFVAVPDAGHWVQFERAAAFDAALAVALADRGAPGPGRS
jgi:2-hydroxy-6-oxonona-2,4-dienedioate hydrolase